MWSAAQRLKIRYDVRLNDTIDQLAMANRVRLNGHVLIMCDNVVMSCKGHYTLKLQVKKTWKIQIEEESMSLLEQRRLTLSTKVDCWR